MQRAFAIRVDLRFLRRQWQQARSSIDIANPAGQQERRPANAVAQGDIAIRHRVSGQDSQMRCGPTVVTRRGARGQKHPQDVERVPAHRRIDRTLPMAGDAARIGPGRQKAGHTRVARIAVEVVYGL